MIAIFVNNRQVQLFEKLGVKELLTGYGYLKKIRIQRTVGFLLFQNPSKNNWVS
jgi:Holliday junction resolvasome RuvABC endonuclease subunit